MNIVFFSSSSNRFNPDENILTTYPSKDFCLQNLQEKYPQHNFSIVTQLPASFLVDTDSSQEKKSTVPIKFVETTSAVDFAKTILEGKPDLAIAATFWIPPYDWMGIKDAMVAQELEKSGMETLCPDCQTQMICFDKKNTADFLIKNSFPCPRSIYVHHEYFWAERGNKDLITNNYKDYVMDEISKMDFPVVIKDCVGLSSYGMEVAVSYKQAYHYLKNGRNCSDRLVEEYLDGLHFGTEIYGKNGQYKIMPPLLFSLNRYGITSPKLSVKMGTVDENKFKIAQLNSMLQDLAQRLKLKGFAQVDLIFKDGKWFIIEINPRLSGMSETYAAAMGKSILEVMVETALGNPLDLPDIKKVCNFKLPLMKKQQIESIVGNQKILYLHQHENPLAKQEREKGYCEVVVAAPSHKELMENILDIEKQTPTPFEKPLREHLNWCYRECIK